jgi:ferric-dicitrate binding protein FerR (iron transport regulator)
MRNLAIVKSSVAAGLSLLLAFPAPVWPQAAGQHAGKVSALIPAVNLVRAGQSLTATPEIPVLWEDTVATGHMARARVALDDGSVLNVGADSSLRVTKHDAAAQQTDLELGYGRVRANAVQQTKPGASFQIRTPTGVAGVVGTDFFLEFENYVMRIIVFEGKVRLCNLAGVCVEVNQGQSSTIRGDQDPDAPAIAPNTDLMDAGRSTALKGANAGVGAGSLAGHGLLLGTMLVIGVAVPVVLVRTLSKTPTCTTGTSTAAVVGRPVAAASSCGTITNPTAGITPR